MGERKGQNKYYPPDYDPTKGGLNKFLGTHALRERARKLHLGILIIRFEMPYNIWCEGCENHIGMGVRYNAEKTKVGMYYSTPVYKFRMKCHLCPNYIEMQTDPGNLDYIINSGARRQERRWDPTENGQVVPDDKAMIRQLSSDPMFKLEHGIEDKTKLKGVTPTLAKLEGLQERWRDDYLANKMMRNHFRTKKKELKAIEDKDNDFLKKNSLDIPLLSESAEDSHIAALLKLEPTMSSEERQLEKRLEIEKKTKFPSTSSLVEGTDIRIQMEKFHEKSEKQRASLGISVVPKIRNNNGAKASSTVTSSTLSSAISENSAIKMENGTECNNKLGSVNNNKRVSVHEGAHDDDDDCRNGASVNKIPKSSDTDGEQRHGTDKLSLSLICDYGSSSSSSSDE